MKAPEFIKNSADLGDAAGYVDVNPFTLQHKRYANIWALGKNSTSSLMLLAYQIYRFLFGNSNLFCSFFVQVTVLICQLLRLLQLLWLRPQSWWIIYTTQLADKARFLLKFTMVTQVALSSLVTRSSFLLNSSMRVSLQRHSIPSKRNHLPCSTDSRKISSLLHTGIWCPMAYGMEERVFSLLSLRHLLRFEKHTHTCISYSSHL